MALLVPDEIVMRYLFINISMCFNTWTVRRESIVGSAETVTYFPDNVCVIASLRPKMLTPSVVFFFIVSAFISD